jgi:hypothetical protein
VLAEAKSFYGLEDSPVVLKTLTYGTKINEKNWAQSIAQAASLNMSLSLKIEKIE